MANKSSYIATVSGPTLSRHGWAGASAVLVVGFCLFALIFHSEIETAIYVWGNSDAYNHCFLVLPIVAYLAWERRDWLSGTTPYPMPLIALLAIPAGTAWFVADRLGVMEGRQILSVVLLEIMFASVLGLSTWRALAVPLLYLFFLVPFGEFLVPPLQNLAVDFAKIGLDLVGIPNLTDGVTIEIPEGTFLVHQACSGLRFLIASAAFAVLYACLIYASLLRRIFFIAVFLGVSVIANDIRVLGTILAAHFIGSAAAVEADHVLWGWLFYLIIGTVIVLIGLPFRQDRPTSPIRLATRAKGRILPASALALLLVVLPAAVARLAADYLDHPDISTVDAAQIAMPVVPECLPVSQPVARLSQLAIDGLLPEAASSRTYECGGEPWTLTLYRFPPRVGVRKLFLSLHTLETPAGWDIIRQVDGVRVENEPSAPIWRVTEATNDRGVHEVRAIAMWIDGKPTGTEIEARINQALNTLRRSAHAPVVAVVTGLNRSGIDRFLGKTSQLTTVIDKWITDPEGANDR